MREKRLVAMVGFFLFLFAVLQSRLVGLSTNMGSARAAAVQSDCLLPLYGGRADIYDCKMRPLTGAASEQLALALPGDASYARLYRFVSEQAAAHLYGGADTRPSLVPLIAGTDPGQGIYTFSRPLRYFEAPIAVHTIGYLGQDGNGVAGIERCYNAVLAGGGGATFVRCTTTAAGGLMADTVPQLVTEQGRGQGVQLTLDRDLQRACEGIALKELETGAIVVMEVKTGQLKAVVSVPLYDPYHVEKAMQQDNTGLVNRAINAYNVGSVFKPLVAAAALKAGLDPDQTYECTGVIEVDGHLYHCNNRKAHGPVDMQAALEVSCNCYFIQLGQQLGGTPITELASLMGFGRVTPLAQEYYASAGNLPAAAELENSGQLASISFGQGRLLATPVQLAACYNTFAGDGVYLAPTLAAGVVDTDTGRLIEPAARQETMRVLPEEVAGRLQQMLRGVIEEGSAERAKPEKATAAGKTGTAQTGRSDPQGVELLDSWFAGYFPAEHPRYTVVVLQDACHRSGESLGPVFAQVCDAILRAEGK